ncbi:ABC transporter permease [Pigmentiphaga soli]|uniref:ABC transporter permease n=1 Tax=Pigmentiphaga soli TaxID=1007095 RepID=A0ABP8H949_9BURK
MIETRALGIGLLTLAVLAVLWEILVRLLHVQPFLLPPPSAVWQEFASRPGIYWDNFLVSLSGTVIGFAVAAAAGVLIGTTVVYSPRLRAVLYPVIVVLQAAPKIAIAPLLIVWLGYGSLPQIVMVALVSFFPVVMSTVAGLSSVEADLLDLVRMLRGGRVKQFLKVAFPQALPFIFSGLKVAATLAVIGQVVAEFVSSNAGLGHAIMMANSELNVAMAFVSLILLCAMGLALFSLVELAERFLIPWNVEESERLFAVPQA